MDAGRMRVAEDLLNEWRKAERQAESDKLYVVPGHPTRSDKIYEEAKQAADALKYQIMELMGVDLSPRDVAFTLDGIQFKAFPEAGSFFGVGRVEPGAGSASGNPILFQVPMSAGDTSPEGPKTDPTKLTEADLVEVTNMEEERDADLLEEINAEFGTAFTVAEFQGRH